MQMLCCIICKRMPSEFTTFSEVIFSLSLHLLTYKFHGKLRTISTKHVLIVNSNMTKSLRYQVWIINSLRLLNKSCWTNLVPVELSIKHSSVGLLLHSELIKREKKMRFSLVSKVYLKNTLISKDYSSFTTPQFSNFSLID